MKLMVHNLVFLVSIVIILLGNLNVASASQSESADGTPPATEANRSIAFYPRESGPGTFLTLEGNPGESKEFTMVFGNAGDVEQTLLTYSTAALSAPNGGFLAAPQDHEPDMPTSWVEYPAMEMNFSPGEGIELVGRVEIPEDANPGEYVTALSAQQSEPFAVAGSTTFDQVVRWSVPVLIIVPGADSPAFGVTEASLERREDILVAEIGIENLGNITVRPKGTVQLIDSSGAVVGVSDVSVDSIYTGTSTVFYVAWNSATYSDTYTIRVSLSAADGAVIVERDIKNLIANGTEYSDTSGSAPLSFSKSELVATTSDNPPSLLLFEGEISNSGEPIENARVSIVTYQDGEEVDRYPIMQAVTIQTGETPVEARYSLPGGFTEGTYTFEVTIEVGDAGTQTVLVTQPIDYEVVVGD